MIKATRISHHSENFLSPIFLLYVVGDLTRSTAYSTWPVCLTRQTDSSITSSSLVDGPRPGMLLRARPEGIERILDRDPDDVRTYPASLLLSNATVYIIEWVDGANCS